MKETEKMIYHVAEYALIASGIVHGLLLFNYNAVTALLPGAAKVVYGVVGASAIALIYFKYKGE